LSVDFAKAQDNQAARRITAAVRSSGEKNKQKRQDADGT